MTNARKCGKWALWSVALALLVGPLHAQAESVPVQVSVRDNIAVALIGDPAKPIADVTLEFDNVSGLRPSSLGLSARLVDIADPALRKRLPDSQLNQINSAFPLQLTIEPPKNGGLKFRNVRVDVHTHALVYSPGSNYRLYKASSGGKFTDITDEIAAGSVRARGTTGGFSQFLVLTDLRPTDAVVVDKLAQLDARIARLPASERAGFTTHLDAVATAVAAADYPTALASAEQIAQRARARAGRYLADEWSAASASDNQVGDLIAGVATLRYSIAYLRDFGR